MRFVLSVICLAALLLLNCSTEHRTSNSKVKATPTPTSSTPSTRPTTTPTTAQPAPVPPINPSTPPSTTPSTPPSTTPTNPIPTPNPRPPLPLRIDSPSLRYLPHHKPTDTYAHGIEISGVIKQGAVPKANVWVAYRISCAGAVARELELVSSNADGIATAILDVDVGNDGAAEIDKVNMPTCYVYAKINADPYMQIIAKIHDYPERKTGVALKIKWGFSHSIDACNPTDSKVAMFGLDGRERIVRVWDRSKPNVGLATLLFLPTDSTTSTPAPSCQLSRYEGPTYISVTDPTAYSEVAAVPADLATFSTDCSQLNCWLYVPSTSGGGKIYSKDTVIDRGNNVIATPASGANQLWVKYNTSTRKYVLYKLL